MHQSNKYESVLLKIGSTIKLLRVKAGYTSYEQFAWDNEISRVQYWKMEKGTNITLVSLLKVLEAHQISLLDFFEMVEIENLDITKST
jgi:hypothetical protein